MLKANFINAKENTSYPKSNLITIKHYLNCILPCFRELSASIIKFESMVFANSLPM